MHQSTFDAVLAVMLATTLASVGYAIRRQITAGEANRQALAELGNRFTEKLGEVSISLVELNTGASAGARAAITDLREELRTAVRDVTREVVQLRNEHDNLAERHASANGSIVQLAERVNGTRELVHELRRDVYARPPRSTPPPSDEGNERFQ